MNTEILKNCSCGKVHPQLNAEIITEKNATQKLPAIIRKLGGKVFVLSDVNTHKAAGEKVIGILEKNNILYTGYTFQDASLKPDEKAVGSAVMHFDYSCDVILGVGSGVINDIGKILSRVANLPYIIVATAPSMDGYASASSSMDIDGLKVSLPSKCPDVIIGDTEIMKTAPDRMLKAGLGDMLAKYISICEWRISHEITGEYYCENIAQLVRTALKKCIDNADGLLKRDEEAVRQFLTVLFFAERQWHLQAFQDLLRELSIIYRMYGI